MKMDWDDVVAEFEEYFRDNEDELKDLLRDLNSYTDILDEDYLCTEMDYLNYSGTYENDILQAMQDAVDGSDESGGSFDPTKDYFYWDGYGCLVSTNELYRDFDPDDVLDDGVIESMYDYRDDLDLPPVIEKLFRDWERIQDEEEDEEE